MRGSPGKDRTGRFSVSPKYVLDFMPGLRMNSLNHLAARSDHRAAGLGLAVVRAFEKCPAMLKPMVYRNLELFEYDAK
jgi:hypothetical protein